jgi:hypothetical protein
MNSKKYERPVANLEHSSQDLKPLKGDYLAGRLHIKWFNPENAQVVQRKVPPTLRLPWLLLQVKADELSFFLKGRGRLSTQNPDDCPTPTEEKA